MIIHQKKALQGSKGLFIQQVLFIAYIVLE